MAVYLLTGVLLAELAIHALRLAALDQHLEEAADVYEVLLATVRALDVDLAAVAASEIQKREQRGGFEGCLWLET